jgi:hypothetical protein
MIFFKQKKWELLHVGLFISISLIFFIKVLSSGDTLFGGDFVTYFFPLKAFIRNHLLAHGSLPFWNPFLFSGTPLIANIQGSMFYPLGFFYYLLPPDSAYVYATLLHFILGCSFMYIFMRSLSVSFAGSFISAIIFIFNGYFMGHVYAGHLTFVQTYIWIPLIFLFLYKFIQDRDYKNPVIGGLLLGVQILGGFPQIVFYTILGLLLFVLCKMIHFLNHQRYRDAGLLSIALCLILFLGFAAAAIQLFPTIEFARLSTRSGGVDYTFATYESLHPKELLAFLIPDIFGNAVDQTYWRSRESWHFWESCGYVGILPLFLVFIRIEKPSHRFLRRVFLILTVLSLFFAMGGYNPLYPLIYKLPGFNSFRIPAQIIFLYVFGVAVVCGIGMERMQYDGWQTNKGFLPFFLITGILFLFSLMGLTLFPYSLFLHLFRNFAEGTVTHANLDGLYGRISASIYQGAVVFLVISLLFIILKKKRLNPWILKILFPVIMLVDLYLFGSVFIRPYHFESSSEKNEVVEELRGSPEKGRIVTLDRRFESNDGLRYGFPSILGYDPLILQRYVRYVLFGQDEIPIDHVVNLGGIRDPREKLLQLLHLKRAVYKEEIVHIKNEIPYAHIVSKAVIQPTEEIVSFMKSSAFNPLEMVVLEPQYRSELFLPNNGEVSEGHCTVIEDENESIVIRTSMDKPGYLVLSEIFYPGWEATVDGEKVAILQGNFLLRVIPLRGGQHEVHLFFVSWPFRIGACISLLTLIGSLWFILKGGKKNEIAGHSSLYHKVLKA